MLLRKSNNGGLHYVYDHSKVDPDLPAPVDRASFVRWFFAKRPTMTRASELLVHYIRENNRRVLLAVDTTWI
ncbi:hypothetical protein ACLX1H_006179 [Fusarium chlamydosporum]